MDPKEMMAALDGGEGAWTEERHASFLNRMEESFVLQLLGGAEESWLDRRRRPRLDRRIPDSATESTRDSSGGVMANAKNTNSGRARKRAPPPCDAAQDQVVPQLGDGTAEGKNSAVICAPKQRKRRG